MGCVHAWSITDGDREEEEEGGLVDIVGLHVYGCMYLYGVGRQYRIEQKKKWNIFVNAWSVVIVKYKR